MNRILTPYRSGSRSADNPLMDLHREMNRLLDEFAGGTQSAPGSRGGGLMAVPSMDVREGEKGISVCCELPGVKPSDVDLRLEGDLLTIRGEKKDEREEKREDHHVTERSFGRFQRSVQLPFAPDPDEVRADFKDGVLTVTLPKRPEQERSRRIEIQGASSGEQQARVGGAQSGSAAESGRQEQKENKKHH